MYIFTFGDQEYKVMELKKGFGRGGDVHPNKQHTMVLVGKVEYRIKYHDGENKGVLQSGEKITIPENHPHIFISLIDSILFEWREGTYEFEYYGPYRKLCGI